MSALQLLWGGGKERKYHNGKDKEDKELTDFVIRKANRQRVTGKGI